MSKVKYLFISFFIWCDLCFSKLYLPPEIIRGVPKEQQLLAFISSIMDLVKKAYIVEFSDLEITEKVISGLFNELDIHTAYLDEETYKFLQEEIKGKFGGLGIYISQYDGFIKINSCLEGTPASKVFLPGDVITHVNGKFIFQTRVEKIMPMLKGTPGTKVRIKIKRRGKPLKEYTLTREMIDVPLIKTEMYKGIAYIRILLFYQGLSEDIHKFVEELKKDKSVKGVVIDVRMNPGGVIEEVMAVSELFLPSNSEILSIKTRSATNIIKTVKKPLLPESIPVVVMIDSQSASASEILAGALQYNDRATIIGELSYGKGSVQTIVPLSSETAIKLTVAKYYLPHNTEIQSIGVTPDVEVKNKYSDLIAFREKDMPRTLKAEGVKQASNKYDEKKVLDELGNKLNASNKKEEQAEKPDEITPEDFALYNTEPIEKRVKSDNQLAKAFEVILDKKLQRKSRLTKKYNRGKGKKATTQKPKDKVVMKKNSVKNEEQSAEVKKEGNSTHVKSDKAEKAEKNVPVKKEEK